MNQQLLNQGLWLPLSSTKQTGLVTLRSQEDPGEGKDSEGGLLGLEPLVCVDQSKHPQHHIRDYSDQAKQPLDTFWKSRE